MIIRSLPTATKGWTILLVFRLNVPDESQKLTNYFLPCLTSGA